MLRTAGPLAIAAAIIMSPSALAERLVIQDVAGVITIETGAAGEIEVEVGAASDRAPAPVVRREEGEVLIDGGLRTARCAGGRQPTRARSDNFGATRVTELQTVTVRAPSDIDLDIRVSAADMTVGAVNTLTIVVEGCGNIEIGDVAGQARIQSDGVGRITVGDVGSASVETNGAGLVVLGEINGPAMLSTNGVGDIEAVSVNGDLWAEANGPTSIEIGTLEGNFRGEANGLADIIIRAGRSEVFEASANGLGATVRFEGTAVDADLSANGLAGITVARVEGNVTREANMARIRVRQGPD